MCTLRKMRMMSKKGVVNELAIMGASCLTGVEVLPPYNMTNLAAQATTIIQQGCVCYAAAAAGAV